MCQLRKIALLLLLAVTTGGNVHGERIKDMASVDGVRSNQLIGYGLVVGLDGDGDQTTQVAFTVQALKNLLLQLGIRVPDSERLQPENVAAVMVTANLPAFAKIGQNFDVTVSSIANSDNLRGGTLLMTPLKGADGQVYAVAQGSLVLSGFDEGGKDGSRVTVNVPNAGRIPNGATVERVVPNGFAMGNSIRLNLHEADFTTVERLSDVINDTLGAGVAKPLDGSTVEVQAPLDTAQRVGFMSLLENLEFTPGNASARVVVNSRTGTVVIGSNVRVMPAAITHGNLTVTISENPEISQPEAFSQGQTAVNQQSNVTITEEKKPMFLFAPGTSLEDIVKAINEVGAAPSDVVAILEALKRAGALRAEFIVI